MTGQTLLLADADATERLGASLALALSSRSGLVVHLHGTLGAGKTTLARGWLRAMGATGPIRSPTYTLVEPYQLGAQELLHMDLYRLQTPEELEGLGLDSYPPKQTWWLVEWPERGGDRLPSSDLSLSLQVHDAQRKIDVVASELVAPLLLPVWASFADSILFKH